MAGRSFAIINGKRIELPPHSSISINNSDIYLDGEKYTPEGTTDDPIVTITIEGTVENITVQKGDVNVNGNVTGHVKAGGTVGCGDVGGTVDAGGSVHCANVNGFVDAGGSVHCQNVTGTVDAGGSVTCTDHG